MKVNGKGRLSTTRAEYDFRTGVRGKYADRAARGTVMITLEPDVARSFPTARAANRALRALTGAFRQLAAAHSR